MLKVKSIWAVKAIFNFTKSEYKAATQSWDAEDKDFALFFNNDGLWSIMGADWQLYKVDNQTI